MRALALGLVLAACGGPSSPKSGRHHGADPPPPPPPWPAEAAFTTTCEGEELAILVQGGGAGGLAWTAGTVMPTGCTGPAAAFAAELTDEVRGACAAAGHGPEVCEAAVDRIADEDAHVRDRPPITAVQVVPLDPRDGGAYGSMRLDFADGTGEWWRTSTKSWGDRFVWMQDDGGFSAQGSRLFRRADGPVLACDVVRDHTAAGTVQPDLLDLSWLEVSELDCTGDASTLAIQVRLSLRTLNHR